MRKLYRSQVVLDQCKLSCLWTGVSCIGHRTLNRRCPPHKSSARSGGCMGRQSIKKARRAGLDYPETRQILTSVGPSFSRRIKHGTVKSYRKCCLLHSQNNDDLVVMSQSDIDPSETASHAQDEIEDYLVLRNDQLNQIAEFYEDIRRCGTDTERYMSYEPLRDKLLDQRPGLELLIFAADRVMCVECPSLKCRKRISDARDPIRRRRLTGSAFSAVESTCTHFGAVRLSFFRQRLSYRREDRLCANRQRQRLRFGSA
jgi:hypothetical protein